MNISKGGTKYMAKKNFATSIDEQVIQDFKVACVRNNESMNTVMQKFMRAYADGRFKLEMQYEKTIQQLEEK